jgi:hypothetical protein
MTDELIDRLTTGLRPVGRYLVPLWLVIAVAVGCALALVAMILWIRLRPDFPRAFGDVIFWTKLSYGLLISAAGFWAAERMSRPGGSAGRAVMALALIVVACALLAAGQFAGASPARARQLIVGSTALVCPWYIVALSVPILAATLLAMRWLAPTRPTLGGLAAGLLSGGAAAVIYSLHCTESGLPFLAIWYTLGIAITAALGGIVGRWVLRW